MKKSCRGSDEEIAIRTVGCGLLYGTLICPDPGPDRARPVTRQTRETCQYPDIASKKKTGSIPIRDQDDALLREVTVTSTEGYEKSIVISSAVLLVTSPRRM